MHRKIGLREGLFRESLATEFSGTEFSERDPSENESSRSNRQCPPNVEGVIFEGVVEQP